MIDEKTIVFLNVHTQKILVLIQAGFFDQKNGSITAHFDQDGNIRKIEKNNVYRVD
jgi:hypothetical protein